MRASIRVAHCEMLFTLLFNKLQYEAFTSRARSDSCREMISPPLSPVHAIYKKLPVLTLIFFQSWYTSLSYWFTRDSKRRRTTSCLHKDITFYQTQIRSSPCLVNPSLNQSLLFFFFSWLYDLAMGTTIMWLALIDVFKYDDVYSINLRVCTVFQSTFIEFQGKTVRWCLLYWGEPPKAWRSHRGISFQ